MFYLRPGQINEEPQTVSSDAPATDWPARYQQLAQSAQAAVLRHFYAQGLPPADTPIAEVPLVAIDFETTGLDPEQGDIVSIGVVPMQLQRIYNRDSRHWIVRPRSRLGEESVVIHGITHSDIEESPDLARYLQPLLEQLAGRVVVAHYRFMERNFLNQALLSRLGEGIQFPVIDTMALEAAANRLTLWQRLCGRRRPSLRLTDCRRRYHLPFYHPHHAHTDALACAELLQAQVAAHYSPQTPVGRLWC